MKLSHDLIVERDGGIDILPKGTEIIIESAEPIELQTKLHQLTCYFSILERDEAVFVFSEEPPPWEANKSVDIDSLTADDFEAEDQFSSIDMAMTKVTAYVDDGAFAMLKARNAAGRANVVDGPNLFTRMAFDIPEQVMLTTDPALETGDDLKYAGKVFTPVGQDNRFYNNWERYVKDMSNPQGFLE